MNAGESPEQRYEKLQQAVQDAILRDYPNPERKGCPGSDALRDLAANRLTRAKDEVWEHVTHCSPCYREYLDLVEKGRQDRRGRNRIVLVTGLAALFALGFWIRGLVSPTSSVPERKLPETVQRPSEPKAPETVAAVLNLESLSSTRGGSAARPQPGDEIQRLPRRHLQLSIYLPIGSEAGHYDVQILKESSPNVPLVSLSGEAKIIDGLTRLEIFPDLSVLEPGPYVLGTRHAGDSWHYFRIVLT